MFVDGIELRVRCRSALYVTYKNLIGVQIGPSVMIDKKNCITVRWINSQSADLENVWTGNFTTVKAKNYRQQRRQENQIVPDPTAGERQQRCRETQSIPDPSKG